MMFADKKSALDDQIEPGIDVTAGKWRAGASDSEQPLFKTLPEELGK
jgi:hypothetical protein